MRSPTNRQNHLLVSPTPTDSRQDVQANVSFSSFVQISRSIQLCLAVLLPTSLACSGSLNLTPSDHVTVLAQQALDYPNPARPGPYQVRRLYYGSGTDKNRIEYRDSVSIVTESVDASKLVSLGSSGDERNEYWGFTPEEFPINGRVWYPEGSGPFPLVLIVHGNHNMKDFSDPGYGYLGELLASRGFVFSSVDMNFINGSIRNENDGRGWLLLKHLDAWKKFAGSDSTPFAGKIDFERIALIGHSRGGEAVGHAAAFNHLERYPDDASLEFNFGYGIRSIIAIAPVDGQYLPTGRLVPVENVNYMVFHGSHDGDVTSFHGLRLYHRLAFTDDEEYFKTAIYMYRANHGQWNTGWGNKDVGPRSGRILDLRGLIDPEDQREMGKIYISAFLETTLLENKDYMPLFRDHRMIGEWLPKTMYVTRFQTSTFRPIAAFDEDIDVTSGTAKGTRIEGKSLATWREDLLPLRSGNRSTTPKHQGTYGVWLGWNNMIAGVDTLVRSPASYSLVIPSSLTRELELSSTSTLDLLLSALDERPPLRDAKGHVNVGRGDEDEFKDISSPVDGESSSGINDEPVDLTIELSDASGTSSRVCLSTYGAIRKPLDIKVRRRNDDERFEKQWELVLQSYSIPLSDFVDGDSTFDPGSIRKIELIFDQTRAGTVVVDDIGFSKMDHGFFQSAAPIPDVR